ncbi:MAG TPA: YafY family protein [Chthonomonadaceae bacterium]|nr:YafY family protein [Chthonomonadaceae bacterium]
MNRMDRLLAIVLELQGKRTRRADDLAATFEVSKRTIYRDMEALCEAGVPLIAVPGRGYALIEGYFLPPLSFTEDEATMLLLGSDFIARHFDAQYRLAAQSAGRKIEVILPEQLRAQVEYLRSNILSISDETRHPETVQKLRRALLLQKTIRFLYRTRYTDEGGSAESVREADPYGLYFAADTWYLTAYCHGRREIRHFRLDRMSGLEVLEKPFARPPGFRMERIEAEEKRRVVVRALFAPAVTPWVKESRSFYIAASEETPDGVLVTLRARHENEVLPWLLGWGAQVRVLEPPSLQKRLAEEARKILEKYF